MKKIVCILLVFALAVAIMPLNALAAESEEGTEFIYYEDGSYTKITITAQEAKSHTTINASKRMEHYTSDDELCWVAVLHGNFSYDSTIAICNYASCDITIYNSNFSVASKTVGKRSNYAYVNFSMERKLLGITVATTSYEMTIYCDKNGNLL